MYHFMKILHFLTDKSVLRWSYFITEFNETTTWNNFKIQCSFATHCIININFSLSSYGIDDPEFNKILTMINELNDLFAGFFLSDLLPIFKYIPTPAANLMKKGTKILLDFINGYVVDHKKNFDESKFLKTKMEEQGGGGRGPGLSTFKIFWKNICIYIKITSVMIHVVGTYAKWWMLWVGPLHFSNCFFI